MKGLTMTREMLVQAVGEYLGRAWPREVTEELMVAAIERAVGTQTIEELMPRMHCTSVRQTIELLRRLEVPVIRVGRKTAWVLLSDLEAKLKAMRAVEVPRRKRQGKLTVLRAVSGAGRAELEERSVA